MEEKPLILVTNDDGITAPGIKSLIDAVQEFGELMIVAPDKPQSGMGHAITVNEPLFLTDSAYHSNHKAYTTTGTPVDCVKLALHVLQGRKPDLIVSGINHGSNASTNVLYSGTMSAAIEGCLDEIPAIGFSLIDFAHDAAMTSLRRILDQFFRKIDCRIDSFSRKAVIKGKFFQLFDGGVDQLRLGKSQ